jgi:hypothetical protein
MEPVSWRPGFAPPATPLTRRLLVYFRSGAYIKSFSEAQSENWITVSPEQGIQKRYGLCLQFTVVFLRKRHVQVTDSVDCVTVGEHRPALRT